MSLFEMAFGLRIQDMYRQFLFATLVAALLTACTTPEQRSPSDSCSLASQIQNLSATQLRQAIRACEGRPESRTSLQRRLNALTALPKANFRLQAPTPGSSLERVNWATEIYFYPGESYPPEEALGLLDALIAKASGVSSVESVRLVGGSERFEVNSIGFGLARARAEFVRTYLASAGLPTSTRVEVLDSPPADTAVPEERAKARIVSIQVVAVRSRSGSTP